MTERNAASETGDPLLLTPGPLTTSRAVKQVMVHDWGSRDATFLRINREVLEQITALAGGIGSHVTVPMQGSGTFAVEAMLTTFIPRDGKIVLLVNGAYGQRAMFGDHMEANGQKMFGYACEMGLEGIISKRADAPYRSGRGGSWITVK